MSPRPQVVAAVQALADGRAVIFPTETVVGLGADLRSQSAINHVFELKGRPANVPLAVMVQGATDAKSLVTRWPKRAAELAERFWPGPLTIILPRARSVPAGAVAGGDTVGLRCPSHPTARALLEAFGAPICATSANVHGQPAATTIAQARENFSGKDVFILKGDEEPALNIESTVLLISLHEDQPDRILREGAISMAELGGDCVLTGG